MNNESNNLNLPSISRYGVALAGLSLCGHATAGVVSLGTNFATINYGPIGNRELVSLEIGSVLQLNDSSGKTVFARYASSYPSNWGIDRIKVVSPSDSLTVQNFGGTTYAINPINYANNPSNLGIQSFGFLTKTGQLGWFQVDFSGLSGDVVYLAGAYSDTPGESIHVGTVPLPPSSGLMALGLLAAGASGVRKLREQKQPQS